MNCVLPWSKPKLPGAGGDSTRSRQNPVTKVLSSPTVIRSVLGILGKILK